MELLIISPMMMAPQSFLLASSFLFILSLTCAAKCTPSACGVIRNISSPFRLNHDPKHCGDSGFELACENDVAFLYFNSHKHFVKEINYLNSTTITITLVDASISKDDVCSFPNYSLHQYNFDSFYYDSIVYYPYRTTTLSGEDTAWPLNLMSCQLPLKNSSLFTQITHCQNSTSNSFRYVKVGHMKASELPLSCRIDVTVLTSWKFRDFNNISLSEIHNSLLYGFQLVSCINCFHDTKWGKIFNSICKFFNSIWFPFAVLVLLLLGVVCAGVSPPVFTVIGFAALPLLIFRSLHALFSFLYHQAYFPRLLIELFAAYFFLITRIILFPVALYLLIYKFRRRHLSMYTIIESFLQSDNKLIPIRYSYWEIKKMTGGFRDKLGAGGYGSVYKGKLRSGHEVAVKLLEKSGAHDEDFINEIATIGRIHHVNIVKLVGYCAQGSKRALILDFMPNGSLEKYLFNRENGSSLKLDRRFEIAVGIARGIEYLHRGCDVQILHFNIKPHNILLDEKFIPKISDFGLAKLCSLDKTALTMTAARGTIGYVAPELISRSIGVVSYKADVYSFGMLLMEMVNLKRDLIGNNGNSDQYFPCWIYDCLEQGKDIEIEIDAENNDNDDMRRLARKMIIVALWCIQMCPNDRPPMNKVLEMLEGDVERLQIPNHPFKLSHIVVNSDDGGSGTMNSTDSIPLLIHADGSSCSEIIVEE